ncbi:pyridoxal phosphate-dependent transferase [Leptodontidium sp. 2 PMI_412]|nr:pyridoxal phosphate-dependent transferase [Leptodontidium sp. 2 PMI_412]
MVLIAPFTVEQYMGKYENTPGVINIAESCADSVSIDDLVRLSKDPQRSPLDTALKLTYGSVLGSTELRKYVAAHCSHEATQLSADDVIISQGAIGANFLALYTLIHPGDHVICVYPTYQQLYEVPQSVGAEVSLWRLREEEEFAHNIQDLKSLIKDNTKMIIINNPNSPTGLFIPTDTLQEIAKLAEENNIILFSDEVYRSLFHGGTSGQIEVPVPVTTLGYERAVVTGSMSKGFALAGIRVGWIASRDKTIMEAIASARNYTTISVSLLDDQIASFALSPATRPFLVERNISLARKNIKILKDFVERHKTVCSWVEPKAGTTAFIRFRKNGEPVDDFKFCQDVLNKTQVYFCPGSYCFGRNEDFKGYVRVGYVGDTDVLVKGLQRLGDFVQENLV